MAPFHSLCQQAVSKKDGSENLNPSPSFVSKVSSVLNKDSKTYGKQYLFDGSEETCWNSDAGDLQWVIVKFEGIVSFSQIHLQFQGGFSCSQCTVFCNLDGDHFKEIQKIYPADDNKQQIFTLDSTATGKSIKLLFEQPTDTYGRIIVYNMDFLCSS